MWYGLTLGSLTDTGRCVVVICCNLSENRNAGKPGSGKLGNRIMNSCWLCVRMFTVTNRHDGRQSQWCRGVTV